MRIRSPFHFKARSVFLGPVLAMTAGLGFCGDVLITATGTITEELYSAGPYLSAQVGDSVTVSFEVFTMAVPVRPQNIAYYLVDPSTFTLDIAGPLPGVPQASSFLEVENNNPNQDSARLAMGLTNGEFVAFEFIALPTLFATTDLYELSGNYAMPVNAQVSSMQITGGGGYLRMEFDSLRIGHEPTFQNFCTPNPNATGAPCLLYPTWLPNVGSQVHLEATSGPPNELGFFLIGGQTNLPGTTISLGNLCLGATSQLPVGRYNLPGVLNSFGRFNSQGVLENLLGTAVSGTGFDVPSDLPFGGQLQIQSGQTWHFQLWYRDAAAQSNFSDGVSVQY